MLQLLKGDPPAPSPPPQADAMPASAVESKDPGLTCRLCGHLITHERERVSVAGAHQHTRYNAAGFVFHFGCFAHAGGSALHGEETPQDTWFPGYVWRYALCGACHTHLGWLFSGESTFFGLILDRLSAPS
jgi:hypothetical protein